MLERLHLKNVGPAPTLLGIGHEERIVRQRRHWLVMYEQGELSLPGLQRVAPLIAKAVLKRDATTAKGK